MNKKELIKKDSSEISMSDLSVEEKGRSSLPLQPVLPKESKPRKNPTHVFEESIEVQQVREKKSKSKKNKAKRKTQLHQHDTPQRTAAPKKERKQQEVQ